MKLSEYQNQIYKNNKNILELYEKNLALKKEAAKSIKDKDEVTAKKLGAEINQNSLKASGIESGNIDLASLLEQRRSILDKKISDIIQKPVTKSSQKELSDAREEIEVHSKLAAQHEREVQKEAQAKKQKQAEIYKSEKTKLYNSASNFIGDPVSLNNILTPLAQKKGTKESVGLGDMMSSGLSAFSFALKNAGSVIDVAGSTSFYKEEAAKIPMGKGVKEEASFFLKLLDDPDSVKFLQANTTKLGNLVETIAPTLISIGIRELSKLPELQERLRADEKKHGPLENLEDKLKKLKAKIAPNEIDNQQITELTEQIGNRKLLEQKVGIAKTVEALEKAGIDAEYIQKKLLPIAINPLKEILKNPKDVIEVANASLDIILEKDPKKTQESLQFIASKIDFGTLIGSSGLQEFLVTESTNLAKIATIVMATNENVKAQADKLGITPEIVQQVIPVVTQIASVALADTNKLTEVYKEMVISNTKISDINQQEKAQKKIDRSELTEEQIKEFDARNEVLKKQKSEVLSEMVVSASKVVLQDNFLDSVRSNVSGLLDKNQVAITQMVTNRLGKLDEESLPRQVLVGVSPEFAANTTAAATGLVSTVLKETTNKQIQSLVASGQSLLTASKEERPAVVQGLANQGMAILSNENVAKSIGQVGQLLRAEKEQVQLIVNNALKTAPVKQQLQELGVAPALVQGLVPLVTEIGAELLSETNVKKIPELYGAFTEFTKSASKEKAQKEIDRSSLNEEQIKVLDEQTEALGKQKNVALSKLIGSATGVVLQDNVLDSVRSNVSGLLDTNQVAITQMVTHRFGKLDEESLPRQVLAGVRPEFAKNTTVAVTGLVSTILKETSNKQIQSLVASGQSLLTASKEERPAVVQALASQGMAILGNQNVAKSIGQVGQLLRAEKEQVQLIVNNALKTAPVKQQLQELGVAPALVQGLVPLVTEIGAELLSEANVKKIPELYGAFTEFTESTSKEKVQKKIDRSKLSKEEIKVLDEQAEALGKQKNVALSKLIGSATDVVLQDNVLDSVRSNVSGLLDTNQVAITQMVTHRLGKLDEESLPRQILNGVSPEFAKNTTAAATGLVSTVLKETTNKQIQSLVASGQSLLTASKEERPAVVQALASQGMAILGNSQVAASLQKVGTTLVNSRDDISKIMVNAVENSPLKGVITQQQIQGIVPIVTKTVGAVLNSSQDIVTIATKSQELLANLEKTTQGLTPKQAGSFGVIIESLSNIANQPGITGTLTKDLPEFLQKNKDNIPDIASNIMKNIPALSTLTKEMGVSDNLIRDAAKLGTDILIDAAPMVDKFARATLKEKDQLVTIISDVRDLANTPKENQKAAMLKVVSNIIALKESSTDLKNIFDKELPNLLEKNQEQLAKVIDGVIHTKAGPGLQLKTEKIIKIVADNLPAVTKLADLYSKGKYAAMFPEIVKLAFKKDVLSTAIGTLSRIKKHKAEKKKEDIANVVEETIKKDVDKEQSSPSSQKKDNQTVSVGISKKTNANSGPERTGLEQLEQIKEKMDKHVSSSGRSSAIISKDKHKKLASQDKLK